ncbi:uncharacterized protein LOC131293787 [Anopheles ziemanni]|uniref:uncharacterized protein LOC131264569 n=1 Tax=Anopheles coustani TaxID=139045 RepID=UPI00265A618B|nr:uncharacterized protein LOC131264569 [Anopheles coustani]XP_058177828.1 uncharacterized protein LOC131293787 [Anopheles ziemanni]
MAIVRAMAKPNLFITITCNPSWVEITQALLPRQQAADRPDLTTRVFREKLKAILADLSAGALVLQKRGLPHAHCLLILGDSDKPRSAADYDKVVSAEIPDSAPCMKDGVCSKHFPKAFCEHTRRKENGYPLYRRRNNGRTVKLDARRNHGVELDNRYVVPYNPWLRENQAQQRADAYAGIMDLASVEHVVNDLQQPIAPPTTLDRAGTIVRWQ